MNQNQSLWRIDYERCDHEVPCSCEPWASGISAFGRTLVNAEDATNDEVRLMAAAPELLQTCQNLVKTMFSADEVRLLLVALAGTDVGEDLHSRCDRVAALWRCAQELLGSLQAPLSTDAMNSSAFDLVASERMRQMLQEGYDGSHDDTHMQEELAAAAACYATPARQRLADDQDVPIYWPFAAADWKPAQTEEIQDRIVELVKSAALTLAEISRLQRLSKSQQATTA